MRDSERIQDELRDRRLRPGRGALSEQISYGICAASLVQYPASLVFAEPPSLVSSVAACVRSALTYLLPEGLAASLVR